MQKPAIPVFEEERQKALESLNILDTKPEKRFDRITERAVREFGVPISTISLIDNDREWYKSKQGIKQSEGKRDISFCGHTILEQSIFVVENAAEDPRFADNPSVIGPPFIKFYAGVTLREKKTNLPIGVFCIKDNKPRQLSVSEMGKLLDLAKEAEDELNKPSVKG